MSDRYDNIPISEDCKKEMTLTLSDRQWLKRAFDMQDLATEQFIKETYDKHAIMITDVVRQMLQEQNALFSLKFDEVNKSIREIKLDIADIKKEIGSIKGDMRGMEIKLAFLKKYSSLGSTIVRMAIGVIIGVALAVVITLALS